MMMSPLLSPASGQPAKASRINLATQKFFVGDQEDPSQLSIALEGAAMHQQHQGWGQTVGLLYAM